MQAHTSNNVGPAGFALINAHARSNSQQNNTVTMADMDMDIDMTVDEDVMRMQAEADAINARAAQDAAQNEAMDGIDQAPEEGEIDSNAMVPTKVHLRGLDNLSTKLVEQGLAEACNMEFYQRLQWIDDTSANAVFDNDSAAADALAALSAEQESEPLKLRNMKSLPSAPDSMLQLRMATEADVKVAGAKDRSRYYLDHPEADPDSRPRRKGGPRRGGGYGRGRRDGYSRYDDRYQRRTSEIQFSESFYDDGPTPEPGLRRASYSSSDSHRRKQVRYGDDDDLFSNRRDGRLNNQRDRSASPARDDDGRLNNHRDRSAFPARDGNGYHGFSDDQPRRPTARQRSPTPPHIRQRRDDRRSNRDVRAEKQRDLFADRAPISSLQGGPVRVPPGPSRSSYPSQQPQPDLFLDRTRGSSQRELFPDKVAKHSRHDALDIDPDEVADAIGKFSPYKDHHPQPYTYSSLGPNRAGRTNNNPNAGRDLFSRISGGPPSSSSGRLNEGEGFSFKGAGERDAGGGGFMIKGASKEVGANMAKELYPYGPGSGSAKPNGGEDLFAGRIKGRAAQPRRKAEDLF